MLQKDSLSVRRNDSFFRSTPPLPPATPAAAAPAATTEPAKPVAEKGEERKESKLIVGPDIKMKGVEVNDCDTLQVEGRIEATLNKGGIIEKVELKIRYGPVQTGASNVHK